MCKGLCIFQQVYKQLDSQRKEQLKQNLRSMIESSKLDDLQNIDVLKKVNKMHQIMISDNVVLLDIVS